MDAYDPKPVIRREKRTVVDDKMYLVSSKKVQIVDSKKDSVIIKRGMAFKELDKLRPARKVHFNYDLDPETLKSVPDFGFNDELNANYWEDKTTVWGLLYDQVKKEPKFERIRNLVFKLSMEKYYSVAKKI